MAVQPLDATTRAGIIAEAQRRAAASGRSPEHELYAYAQTQGINNSDLDTYMGFSPGSSQSWADQNIKPASRAGSPVIPQLGQTPAASGLVGANMTVSGPGNQAATNSPATPTAPAPQGHSIVANPYISYGPEGSNQDTPPPSGIAAGTPAPPFFAPPSGIAAGAGGVQPLDANTRAGIIAEAQRRAAASGRSPEHELYAYAQTQGINNSDLDTYMGFSPGSSAQWAAQNVTGGGTPAPGGGTPAPGGGTGVPIVPGANDLDEGTSVTQSGLPAYLQPYVSDVLARGQALTGSDPYEEYSGTRVAGPSALQQQVTRSLTGDIQPYLLDGAATLAAGAKYTPGLEKFGLAAAQHYMNPYQQQVTDIAKREATRDDQIAGTMRDSKAGQAGAFGGTRHGVIEAEAQRNLGQRLSDIQTQGLNTSWGQAQGQFNADQTRMQQDRQYGSQAGIKGGSDMLDASGKFLGMQATQGLMDQNTAQQQANVGYQNFLSRQQHPYQQLSFMKDLTSNYPGTTSVTQSGIPQESSNWASDLAGVGSAVGGIGNIFGWWAKGGPVKTQSGLGHGRVAQLYGSLK